MDLQCLLLRAGSQCIWPSAFFFGRAEDGRDVVASRKKRFEHCFSKVLLPDNCDLHLVTVFGGSVNAPACFLAAISASLQPSTSLRISSVCSPNMGDRSIFAGEAESLIGIPILN